ncbi:hypothetical protein Fcan01_25260 [Folsomia candida]|uniref:Uncharacterized protein n=1 Tax=Folsomia candida TaxID=158441 RepID=A0A226D473_FOLCA|nr:hypothetical protein Fcan01_25260 [Folsomia candida]
MPSNSLCRLSRGGQPNSEILPTLWRKKAGRRNLSWFLNTTGIEVSRFRVVIIIQLPPPKSSIFGLLNAFEDTVWWSILACCVGISLILQFDANQLPNSCDILRILHTFIIVLSSLFGQSILDDIMKKVKNKEISRPLLGIWFFVCYNQMMNLYAGDIYFDLIIPTTVIIPATFGDFLVANVTIITTPFVSPGSKTDHIDTYEYLRLLKTKGMIAIMGAHKFVQVWKEVVHIKGYGLVIGNHVGDSILDFESTLVSFVRRNFISP